MIDRPAQPAALLQGMSALAEPTRLRILRLLERQELGVAELCQVLRLPQSTVSRHLKVLAEQGLLQQERQGTSHFYRMVLDELSPWARKLWLLAREQTDAWSAVQQDQVRLAQILAQRQAEQSQQFFAGAAANWEKMREELYGRAFSRAALLALLPAEAVAADLGCGTGQVAAELARYVGKVIAVDHSEAMLRASRKRYSGAANLEFRRGELEALPIESHSCDLAVMVLVLSYVAEPAAALAEMARILRPGGRAVIVDLLKHDREDFRRRMGQSWPGFATEELTTLLQQAGLTAQCAALPGEPGEKTQGPALLLARAGRPVEKHKKETAA